MRDMMWTPSHHPRRLWLLLLAGCLLAHPAWSTAATRQTLANLPMPAQAAIAATLGKDQPAYHAKQQWTGFTFNNPRHAFTATLTPQGLGLTQSSVTTTLQLTGYGYGSPSQPLRPIAPIAHANRVEYRRGPLTEWYVNGPLGLEQGLTLRAPPSPRRAGPLTFAFAIGGALTPRVEASKTAAELRSRTGKPQLRYTGLTVTDATGAALPAWLTVDGSRLLIQVDEIHARYPLTIDPFIQRVKLTASDGAAADEFGYSVAIDGDTVVVGAWLADIGANANQGAAYVFTRAGFTRTGGVWTQQAKLTASDGARNAALGSSVAIDGDTVVVGARGANTNQGAAYVFVKPATGWVSMTQTAELTAANGRASDFFGRSVALSGDTVVVGADEVSIDAIGQGAAYVFVKPATGWVSMTQTAELTAADAATFDHFGYSVAISGDTVVVGAYADDIGANANEGSAYVFTRAGGVWTQTAKLTASDRAASDHFGTSVALSGDSVVVGADGADIGANADQGAAYVFAKPATGWASMTQTAKLTAADGAASDFFGFSVAISGDTVVVGAVYANINANTDQGAAYVFAKPATGWASMTQTAKLTASDRAASDHFGTSVALSGDSVVVGATGTNTPSHGAAYVFVNAAALSGWSAVSGGGQTGAHPAALLDSSGTLHLYIQGVDNGLWVNTKSGSTWSGWSVVAGGGKSSSAPAAVLDGSSVRLVVRGLDNAIWTALADNPQWTALGGKTNHSPTAVMEGSTLHLVVRGTDGGLYLNSRSGGSFSGWSAVPGGGKSSSQPAAVFDSTGTLHLYIQGMDNGLWVNTKSGSTWSGWSAVPGGGKSSSGPAAVLDDSLVRLGVRGLDNGIWTTLASDAQTSQWGGWEDWGGQTQHTPTAVLEGSTLHLFVRGLDGRLYLNSRTGGSSASERAPSEE